MQLITGSGVDIGDLNLFIIAWLSEGTNRIYAARLLNELDAVEIAHAGLRSEHPSACTDPTTCQLTQRYLEPEPVGLGVEAERMWCLPGGRGFEVTIFDLEL